MIVSHQEQFLLQKQIRTKPTNQRPHNFTRSCLPVLVDSCHQREDVGHLIRRLDLVAGQLLDRCRRRLLQIPATIVERNDSLHHEVLHALDLVEDVADDPDRLIELRAAALLGVHDTVVEFRTVDHLLEPERRRLGFRRVLLFRF